MSSIDPYSSFTIDLGPQYVERVFDMLLTKQGVNQVVLMKPPERLDRYLRYLHKQSRRSNLRQYCFIQFYLAHFSQQLAGQFQDQIYGRHLREKALCHYETYLELAVDLPESRFYAQWQTGVLQSELDYPWQQIESSFLKATTLDPLRGEPLKEITKHYCRNKTWKTAYALSGLTMRSYFDKNPVATRRWYVDPTAYNWHLAHYHLHICYKAGHLDEAKTTFQKLLNYACRYPDELTNSDMHLIHNMERLFPEPKPDIRMANAS